MGRWSSSPAAQGNVYPLEPIDTVYGLGTVKLVPLEACAPESGSWFADDRYVAPVFVTLVTVKVTFAVFVLILPLVKGHVPMDGPVVAVVHERVLPLVSPVLQVPVTVAPLTRAWFWSCTVAVTVALHRLAGGAGRLALVPSRSPM